MQHLLVRWIFIKSHTPLMSDTTHRVTAALQQQISLQLVTQQPDSIKEQSYLAQQGMEPLIVHGHVNIHL